MDQKKEYLTKDNKHYKHDQTIVRSFDCSKQANLVIFGQDNQITVLNRKDLSLIKVLKHPKKDYRPASLLFLKDGKSFLCWNNGGTIDLWDIDSGTYKTIYKNISPIDDDEPLEEEPLDSNFADMLRLYDDPRDCGQILGIDNNLAVVSRTIDFWITKQQFEGERFRAEIIFLNIQTGQIEGTWLLKTQYKNINLTDNLLVCADKEGFVDIYSLKSQELLKTFEADFSIWNAKVSQDKAYVICSGHSNLVLIFNFHTGKLTKTVQTNSGVVHDFELISDNHCLIACEQSSLTYYSVDNQQCLSSVKCGEFPKHIYADKMNQSMLAVDSTGVNLVHYKTDEVPSLTNLCVNQLGQYPTFFQNREVTKKEIDVLSQYFDIEQENEKNDKKTINPPKQS